MEKFIPFEKLSKKKQRAMNAARRGSWNGVNPVTRKTQNAKAYNRKKARLWSKDFQRRVFLFSDAKTIVMQRCAPFGNERCFDSGSSPRKTGIFLSGLPLGIRTICFHKKSAHDF